MQGLRTQECVLQMPVIFSNWSSVETDSGGHSVPCTSANETAAINKETGELRRLMELVLPHFPSK